MIVLVKVACLGNRLVNLQERPVVDEESWAFDARKTRMCEDQKAPRTLWRTSSLVGELQDSLASRLALKPEERDKQIRRFKLALQELTQRGVDAESLVRYGMIPEILGPVLGVLLVHRLLPQSGVDTDLQGSGVDVAGWRALLKIPAATSATSATPSQVQELVLEVSREVFDPLLDWIRHAGLNELVHLIPPEESDFWSVTESVEDETHLRHKYRWLVERFTQTYLANWSLAALHLEYRWQKDIDPSSFPDSIMRDRNVSIEDLNAEIAHRAVLESKSTSESLAPTLFLMNQLENHAVTLLRERQYSESAALFNFAIHQWPNDPRAHNDLGFCLIPENPSKALVHLTDAARMGYEPYAINTYNKMCCHLGMHQPRAALALAEEFWRERPGESALTGVIWKMTEEGWRLEQGVYIRSAIAGLVASIASAHGWEEEEVLWRSREQSAPLGTRKK
ncbi:hypothetical protein [Streptosporangium sp. NPDC023615]|uniref:hypothetical protein n=1 Tax=Streptosporangium sp. NPDC023615 TaxID=3154794 RepID=UPI0034195305